MRKIGLTTLLLLLLSASVPALASTATDFYLELLRRGTAEVDAGRFDTSVTPLRLAAFGLIDSIEHYETAQAYLAVAFDRLGQPEEARRSALRVVTAEGVERKFATLRLPAAVRAEFGTVARKLLSSADAATLMSPPPSSTAPRQGPPAIVPPNSPGRAPVIPPAQTQRGSGAARPTPQQDTRTVPFPEPARKDPPKLVENAEAVLPKPAPTQAKPQPRIDPPKVAARPQRTDPPKVVAPKMAAPKPQPVQAQPVPQAVRVVDVPSRLVAGERALAAANLTEAQRVYRELLTVASLDRASLIRIGEGLYRARDFAPALTAFRRLGALRAGEEAYRYYIAVTLYETADYGAAKRELAAALPFIEITPDVQRYRVKIEGARN